MRKNNDKLVTTHAAAEIHLSFGAARFNEETTRNAIQKQVDAFGNLALFVGKSKKTSPARRSIMIHGDWHKDGSSLSLSKWSTVISNVARAIVGNVEGVKDCKLVIIDRDYGTKSEFKIT